MPIYFAELGQEVSIREIRGTDKVRRHLQNLGFITGEKVIVINKVDENLIVKLRGISMAIGHDLAKRIIV